MTRPVLFLDIDGVLNTGRGAFLPQNLRLAQELRDRGRYHNIQGRIAFDPVAVALLNYLVERADAQLVVHSSWYEYFRDRLPEVLAAQGVDTSYVYENWYAEAPRSYGRDERVDWWFGDRGRDLDRPTYAILDDRDFQLARLIDRHVHIDGNVGLTVGDVRLALKLLGVDEDQLVGLFTVSAEDWQRIWCAHNNSQPGDYVRALRWLHGDQQGRKARAERLANEPDDDPLAVLGVSGKLSRDERRELMFKQLPSRCHERQGLSSRAAVSPCMCRKSALTCSSNLASMFARACTKVIERRPSRQQRPD
jgi:hypothetical protein